ncbi:type II toxin-antitoxin system VapC family toxin [Paludisphaera mucosa]|uniref:Type II toxin-antitoxin system VapC family toxin n=1 Tax=Paludisphaera mucosa TaxID=3030827 RepID=A0ABT6FDV9_9BACT|nr:type II toxin-antitoxin system VapC family toxin [Paludisphaera mucosa]MDG3005659.1 type II toxin-antitoxin system VapC family toxin [Paludisphaera mucosa]
MRLLVDTNILVRLIHLAAPMHGPTSQAVARPFLDGGTLCITPQNLDEYWVVSTRPTAANGLGRTPSEALADIEQFKSVFPLLDDVAAIYAMWEEIVASTPVIEEKAHDARLVAAVIVHGVDRILTLNPQDFRAYPDIQVVTPGDVLAP